MGMFEEMKRTLECAIGEYRIINYCGSLILAKCFRISWDGLIPFDWEWMDVCIQSRCLKRILTNSRLWTWRKRLRLWKGNKMKWILLFLISWIAYTVLLAFIGGFHEDDKGLYVICGAMCSGICAIIVFVVWLIVRMIV